MARPVTIPDAPTATVSDSPSAPRAVGRRPHDVRSGITQHTCLSQSDILPHNRWNLRQHRFLVEDQRAWRRQLPIRRLLWEHTVRSGYFHFVPAAAGKSDGYWVSALNRIQNPHGTLRHLPCRKQNEYRQKCLPRERSQEACGTRPVGTVSLPEHGRPQLWVRRVSGRHGRSDARGPRRVAWKKLLVA
jgi:hypothetical protein